MRPVSSLFRSATFKLTMWYLAIVMVICVLFSIVLYGVATTELSRGLHSETQKIYLQFPVFQNSHMLQPESEYDYAAHRLLLRLVALNALVLIGAGMASYLLAKRTLSPIEIALRMESEVALLSDKSTAQELRETLASNLEEVGKLEQLINNLLRLTRLEETELRHSFSAVSSKEVLAAAITTVSSVATQREVHIEVDIKDFELYGDYNSLVQLLVILLDNAIKYSRSGDSITVASSQTGEQASIQITDHGVGIEPEALQHIFERFYRADSSRNKTGAEGYGLGLSIAKMIADIHQGDITLASQQGAGTTVTVTLPLAPRPS
jgi:signal transduction histidine kinase